MARSTAMTASESPSTMASTRPSGRFLTQPIAPSRRAVSCVNQRKPTPCTRPLTTNRRAIFISRAANYTGGIARDEPWARPARAEVRLSDVDGDGELPRVVLEVVVVHAQIQTAGAWRSNRSVLADEYRRAVAEPCDQAADRGVRHRRAVGPAAAGAGRGHRAAIAREPDGAVSGEGDGLACLHADTRIDPVTVATNDDAAARRAHARRRRALDLGAAQEVVVVGVEIPELIEAGLPLAPLDPVVVIGIQLVEVVVRPPEPAAGGAGLPSTLANLFTREHAVVVPVLVVEGDVVPVPFGSGDHAVVVAVHPAEARRPRRIRRRFVVCAEAHPAGARHRMVAEVANVFFRIDKPV